MYVLIANLIQVNWSEQCEIPMLYVLCHEKNYYCGGTNQGKRYLTTHPRIPEEFLHFVNVGTYVAY